MSTALALIEDGQYNLMAKLARIAAQSGYSKQNETQAMFIMLKGFELGISPMQALDGIQVIQGKTTVSPQLMLALINRSGQLEDMEIDSTAVRCIVTMKRVGRSPHTETFTMDNAKAMQLAGKDNWNKQPAVMLKWRAVSACARIVFPDVIQGMYTPEEMGAEVSEDASGEIIIEQAPLAVLPPPNVEVSTGEIVEGVITETPSESNEKPPSSDLDASDQPDIATNGKTPAERLGTPSGQRIGKWSYDRNALLTALSTWAKDFPYQERNNVVKALDGEKAFDTCATINDAVQIVIARLNSPEHGKSKKAKKADETPANEVTF